MVKPRWLIGILLVSCAGTSSSVTGATLPQQWHVRTAPTSSHLKSVAYGNNLFVAVGSGSTILTSSNGTDWIARPIGNPPSMLNAVAYSGGRYVAGAQGGALTRFSTNAILWANGLSATGLEQIHGLKFGYGEFVAVGSGPLTNTSYILTSSNGLNWIIRSAPTTNRLLAVSAAISPDGTGWADFLYVAVGERGTIVTSTNGRNWVLQKSGTSAALRSVLWNGRFLVGGDSGTILTSQNGSSWSPASPTSFVVRGLASSRLGGSIVAVGNFAGNGRVHASEDGLTWPGLSTEFQSPLNAVVYGQGSFIGVGDSGLIIQASVPVVSQTNQWTNPDSGSWEEPFWSLGVLPNSSQTSIAFTNPGWKALAIGSRTTANFPDSLSIQNLIVDAPVGSMNLLLLNYANLDVPLFVHSDFILGSNGSLVGYRSALRGGNLHLSGPAAFSENSEVTFDRIVVGANAPASLSLTNASLSANWLRVSQGAAGTVRQSGGTTVVSNLQMNVAGSYLLREGTLLANTVDLQSVDGNGLAKFTLSGGSINVAGPIRLGQQRLANQETAVGEFVLEKGIARFGEIDFLNGSFTQLGGTNSTLTLALPERNFSVGQYFLTNGLLTSSLLTLGKVVSPDTVAGSGSFVQSGGVHSNSLMQLFGEIRTMTVSRFGHYTLNGGLLRSSEIQLLGGAFAQSGGTNLVKDLGLHQASLFGLTNGLLDTSNTTLDTCCCVMSLFVQHGGTHAVKKQLILRNFVRYQLMGGVLKASNIEIDDGAELLLQGGLITNTGLFTLRSGILRAGGQRQLLGQLQVLGEIDDVCTSQQFSGPVLDVGFSSGDGSTVLRFLDSRDVTWSGAPLIITNWSSTTAGFGPDHIFIGTNVQALTSAQLSRIVFVNPFGLSPGRYQAKILPTGELVPIEQPSLSFTLSQNSLVLAWDGVFDLLAATNAPGPYLAIPGAKSPMAIPLAEPKRFFRLRSPNP